MSATAICPVSLLTQAEFDGELDAVKAAEVVSHRAGCAQCQSTYAALQQTRSALRQDGIYRAAPDDFRQMLATRLAGQKSAAQSRPQPKAVPWWSLPLGFAAGAAAMALAAFLVWAPVSQPVLDQVTASHVRALQAGHLMDVASTDQHTVRPWFDGKLDFAPPVKDLAAQDFPLTGGRLDYLDGRAVAALVYRHGPHPINLFVWPSAGKDSSAATLAERNGYNVATWRQDGMTLWAISDLDRTELQKFVGLWRDAP